MKNENAVGAWGDKQAQLGAVGLAIGSASVVCEKLGRTGGWRLRADIAAAVEAARMSFSAAQAYYEAKNWDMMLLELSDGVFAVEEIKTALRGTKPQKESKVTMRDLRKHYV